MLQLMLATIGTSDTGADLHTTGLLAMYNQEFSGVSRTEVFLSLKVSVISQARLDFCFLVDPGMATSQVPWRVSVGTAADESVPETTTVCFSYA